MSEPRAIPSPPPDLILTRRLQLRRSSAEQLRALLAGPVEFEPAAEFREGLKFSLEKLAAGGDSAPWWTPYLVVRAAADVVIGLAGCKGPPDGNGVVELGYGTAPAYRGQGYATEMATALAEHVCRLPGVTVVCAHTLPEPNASTRVLTKCGFRQVGEVNDPTDGLIWRWELSP